MNFAPLPKWLTPDVPVMKWIEYKGETYVACPDFDKSDKCHRPIIDLSYCMTKAFNNIVEKTVNYVPEHFKPSPLETRE